MTIGASFDVMAHYEVDLMTKVSSGGDSEFDSGKLSAAPSPCAYAFTEASTPVTCRV